MKKFSSLVSVVALCLVPGVFGMHGPNRFTNNNLIVEKARGILKGVRIIDENTKRMSTNPVILLGATGSGKTSLLHVLAGTTMKASKSDEAACLLDRCSLVPSENAADRIGKVAGGVESVTSGIHPFQIGNVLYCDGPGFFDTNGGLAELGNHLLMNEILRKGAKILWVVSVDEIDAMRGEAAEKSFNYLKRLLPESRTPGAERQAKSVGIVISKGVNGTIQNGLNLLIRKKSHHWLIDYLFENEQNNAFWLPAPKEEGVYAPPEGLVERITSFATRQSELIYGSMSLQPSVIADLEKMHEHFDVTNEINGIVGRVSGEFCKHKGNLSKLQGLERAYDTLWRSLAIKSLTMLGISQSQDELVNQWKRKSSASSDARKKFNFSLRDFVDVLNKIEYFRVLCGVKDDGFGPRFERGLVWEELIECISNLSNTEEEKIAQLKNAGDNWKEGMSDFAEKGRNVSEEVKKKKQARAKKLGVNTVSVVASGIGAATFNAVDGRPLSAAIGGASGAMIGANIGSAIVRGVNFVQNQFGNRRGVAESALPTMAPGAAISAQGKAAAVRAGVKTVITKTADHVEKRNQNDK